MKTLFPILGLVALVQLQALADEQGQYVKAAPKPARVSMPFSVDDFYTRDLSAAELNQFLKQKRIEQAKAMDALQSEKQERDNNLSTWSKKDPHYPEQNADYQQFLSRMRDTISQMDAVNLNLMQKIIAKDSKSPYTKNKQVVAAKKLLDEQDARDQSAQAKAAREKDRAFKQDPRYLALQDKLSRATASLAREKRAASDQVAKLQRKIKVCQSNSVNVTSPVPQSVQALSDSALSKEALNSEASVNSEGPAGAEALLPTRPIPNDLSTPIPSVIPLAVPAK